MAANVMHGAVEHDSFRSDGNPLDWPRQPCEQPNCFHRAPLRGRHPNIVGPLCREIKLFGFFFGLPDRQN